MSGISDDILEENIVKCFSAIHKVQFILGSIRTTIKDGVVQLPSYWHNLYSLVAAVFITFSAAYLLMFYYNTFYHINTIMFYACFFGTGSAFVSYVTCLFMARFTNEELNVQIYYMFQKIDRVLQLTRDNDYFLDFQIRVQDRTMMLICLLFPLGFAVHTWAFVEKPMYALLLFPGFLTIYIDTHLCGCFLYYIAVRISIFNQMLKNQIRKYENKPPKQKSPKTIVQTVMSVVQPSFDRIDCTLEWEKWSECIQLLLKSFQMVNEIFNFQAMNLTVTVMIWTFIAIASMVVGLRSGLYPLLSTITIGAWAIYYVLILTVATILVEWFTYQIKRTKILCIRVMSYNYDDPYRKAANEILRTIHVKKPRFIVYGIFEMNSSLPLTVIGIITTNVLVVVQFVVSRDH